MENDLFWIKISLERCLVRPRLQDGHPLAHLPELPLVAVPALLGRRAQPGGQHVEAGAQLAHAQTRLELLVDPLAAQGHRRLRHLAGEAEEVTVGGGRSGGGGRGVAAG